MNYPKALYKGNVYQDWQKFTYDLGKHIVQSRTVKTQAEEDAARAEGFTDAAALMGAPACARVSETPVHEIQQTTLTIPKKRGMPKGGWPKKCQPSAT